MSDNNIEQRVNNIEQRVKDIIAQQLNVSEDKITLGASFLGDLGADSLDLVELIMAFEEEFKDDLDGAEIPEEDSQKMKTVENVIVYILKKTEKLPEEDSQKLETVDDVIAYINGKAGAQ